MENSYSQLDINALKERAEAGDADAQELYGTAFDEGNGVDRDMNEAIKWYEQAADQGKLLSQANIGWAYLSGRVDDEPNIEKGLAFLESAMEGGNPSAYGSMAVAYLGGLGVEKDLDKAVSLARKAFEEGGRNRDGMILAEAILHRDEDRADMSEVISIYQSVADDESEDPATRQQAEERLKDFGESEELDELFDVFGKLKNGKGMEEIEASFREAASEINESNSSATLLPSELIEAYLDMFCHTQPHWYETYADSEGKASTSGTDFDYDARTVIVEGDGIAYLVLDQDGKVQKLHPAYDLDDESIGETEKPLVATLGNVNGNFIMIRYIPGVDGYSYLTWRGGEDPGIDPGLLEAIDANLGRAEVDTDVYLRIGAIIYQAAWDIQAVMKEEGFTVSDISDDLPEVLEPLKGHILALQEESAEFWEDEGEDVGTAKHGAYAEEKTGFIVRQEMLSTAMLIMSSTVLEAIRENDVGDFPFYVLCGEREALAILHEGGELEDLEAGYELPREAFDQNPSGFTLDASGLLGFPLQLIPVPQGE
jgi:hypothetical protein